MKRGRLLKPVLWLTAACIILPAIVLLIWCFAARWPWPGILPESLSLRTVKELIFGSAKLPKLLLSSISLSFAVAAISTTIGIATARATELYEFRGKGLIRFFSLLPLLVPGTVLAIGAQIMLLKVGLGDSIAGIILIHTVASVPYCITIMTDVTAALGDKFEEQAATLGAGPFRAFFEVTLPNLMPGIMSSFSMGFIISYSQYFTTLIIGGGRINTISLVLVPYIQGGDRSLASVYAMAFTLSALGVFAMLELLIYFEEGAGWQALRGIFPYAVSMLPQRGYGLGERMYNAIRSVLAMGYGKCVLIGSDIPEITAAHLQSGFDALESADVTLGPTEDGGYYLVGMKKPNKAVFEKQEYGTDSVYDNAVAAVKEAGLSFAPAMMCRDVDTPQDLMELKKRLCGKSSCTAQCIDKIL